MDREKVINGLELIIWEVDHNSMWLPGADDIRDAIALLKEQEAKQVNIAQAHCEMKYGLCPRCEKQIDTLVNPSFCGNCGQAVKWE